MILWVVKKLLGDVVIDKHSTSRIIPSVLRFLAIDEILDSFVNIFCRPMFHFLMMPGFPLFSFLFSLLLIEDFTLVSLLLLVRLFALHLITYRLLVH